MKMTSNMFWCFIRIKYMKQEKKNCLEGCIKLGPWGGPNGNKWSFDVNGGITKIVVVYGEAIDSLLFKSIDEEGLIRYSPKFGGNGGDHTDKVTSLHVKSIFL